MKRRNKYRAKPTRGFPSKLEAAVFDYLTRRETLGEITDIKRQQSVTLIDGPKDIRIRWKIDFSFQKNGKTVYAEAKGIETGEYRLKLRLFKKNPPGRLEVYKGSYLKIYLAEVVECQ